MLTATPSAKGGRFELTAEQRAAVEWQAGPLMVLAGAGTGKTTVVVERVRHLLARDDQLRPEDILVLTYNVRAAAELVERLEEVLGMETASRLWVHDFHAFGDRILADHGGDLGLGANPDVLDEIGQRLLLRDLRPRFSHFLYHFVGARSAWVFGRFAELISRAKDELVSPQEYLAYAHAKREAFDFANPPGAFQEAVADIRARDSEGRLRGVRDTRAAIRAGLDATASVAMREARREASGGPFATYWELLSDEQKRLARGLKSTFIRDAEVYDVLRLTEEAEAYAIYQEELRARGLLDFGELQLRAIELLTARPNILRRYQAQFRHVLVDEFQDVNMAQLLLLELIARGADKPDDIVVVGDDDQSIYRFRGASYAAFERFRMAFERSPAWAPERAAQRVHSQPLLENRRSSGNILSVASRLIERNSRRLKSEPLRPTRSPGARVQVAMCADEADEADLIVSYIRQLVAELPEPRRWSDIAVLYRKHRHRDQIVDRLRREDIPFVVVGGSGLFAIPEVRDVEAALRVCADPADSVSLVRLLSAGPWRLDATEVLRLTRAADWDGRSVYQACLDVLRDGALPVEALAEAGANGELDAGLLLTLWTESDLPEGLMLPDSIRERRGREARARWRQERLDTRLRLKLERLKDTLEGLVPRARRDGPYTVLEGYLVRTSLLHDLIAVDTPDSQRTVLALARLMRFTADWQRAHPHESLADFVAYLDAYQQVGGDLEPDLPGRVHVDGVQLMTVYQAKGLEYEVVVLPRLVEGQFPDLREESQLMPKELLKQLPPDDFAIDEERRLAFVAMTRARSHLLLTAIQDPNGKPVSRFVGEAAPLDDEGSPPTGVQVRWRTPMLDHELGTDTGRNPSEAADHATSNLLKLMPLPDGFRRRFALRRRAVEIIGALEELDPLDHHARSALTTELVAVASDAAGLAEETRRDGLDPLTISAVAGHSQAGRTLLEVASLPPSFSHSQFYAYAECPLRYAFERVYRIPTEGAKSYFEFGTAIHQAFEAFVRARRDALAAGGPAPDYAALREAFDRVWVPTNYPDAQAAEHYQTRVEPALRRFYEREVANLGEAVDVEAGFNFALEPGDGSPPVRFYGQIDRIDRRPDGSIELTDYKTGRPKTQAQVDADAQLSLYALALSMGAVLDPVTGQSLPPASRLILYFTETDQAVHTTRSMDQLDALKVQLVQTAGRIRSGDFAATPSRSACSHCDYARLCPSRWGEPAP